METNHIGWHRYERNLVEELSVYAEESFTWDRVEDPQGGCSVRNRLFTLVYGFIFAIGMAGPGVAEDNGAQQPSARQQLQQIHTPQSIDQELSRLRKDLELTPEQQQQVRPLLEEHHDRIQALLDKYPTASRQELGPQIHAISDETHRKIDALLTLHQKELEKAMQQREHSGRENRRSLPPAAASPKSSSSLS
jgi:periplasmic protein CpxP/Spy